MDDFSYLEIVFSDDNLVDGNVISFDVGDGSSFINILETFGDVRYEGYIAPLPTIATGTAGEATAINFVNAFNADYNVSGIFIVERIVATVNIYITEDFSFDNINLPTGVTATEHLRLPPFEITDVSFSAGSDCSKITVSITTNQLADEILQPVQQSPTTNPIVFEFGRSVSFEADIRKGTTHKYQVIGTPSRLFSSGITIDAIDNPAGSTVTILAFSPFLTFKYSLDGTTYFTSNIFTNLIGGQYTAYVKDQYGCVTTKDFELDGFGINSPFFYLSEANSIRFANRVTWGDCANYKNDFNTLSCEMDVPLPKKEIQQFQTCDVITTQFKSNYKLNSATLKLTDNNLGIIVPISKKTNNMRLKDKRDAKMYDLSDTFNVEGKIGVYFMSGNLYDYDLGNITGNYTLYGSLPEWGKQGNFLQLPFAGWYLIEDVIYFEDLNAEMLVITAPLVSTNTIVSSFYNRENYEVYEFTIDFAAYTNKKLTINIKATDPYFDDVEFGSELINIQIRHKNTIEIRYSNDENTDIYYASGIENKLRLPIERIDGAPIDQTETYDTDTGTILLSTDIRKSDVFKFYLTKQMMWKLVIALSHTNVKLDGVAYVKKSIAVDGAMEETNLYEIDATMVQSNSAYRGSGLQFDESGMEIPGLIPTGTGYIKYQ